MSGSMIMADREPGLGICDARGWFAAGVSCRVSMYLNNGRLVLAELNRYMILERLVFLQVFG